MAIIRFHWICSYDIRNPKRLKKIHQHLSMLGIAMNYSVFYLYLTQDQFQYLIQQLKKMMHANDDVRLYRCVSLHLAHLVGNFNPSGIHLMNGKSILF